MDTASQIAQAYPKAGMALSSKIVQVAHDLGADPFELANLINFESGMTFRSDVQNPTTKATGLIQFTRTTAKKLGTTTDALGRMNPVQQMDWVHKYLERVKQGRGDDKKPGALDSMQRLAMAVFYPWARDWHPDESFSRMGHSRVTKWNPGINRPADYLEKMEKRAKLKGKAEAPGALAEIGEWLSSWVPTFDEEPSSTPAQGSQWSSNHPGLQLEDSNSHTYGPGQVPSGAYKVLWHGQPARNVTLVSGRNYSAVVQGTGLRWSHVG